MHLLDPHSPWDVREESSRFYDPKYDGPWLERGGSRFFEEDPRELARLRSLYEGEVFAIDVAIGRFIRSLRASGALDRSVLVLTSDHGEEFMEHGWLQHGQLYESNVRIPWILHHPDLAQGRRIETRVSQVDLAPTLTALTGLSSDAPFDGRDLRIAAEPVDPLHAYALTLRQFRQISLRRGDMKLIVECGRRAEAGERPTHQLFDLAADPAEANDLAGLRPELTSAMSKELWSRLEAAGCADLRRSAGRQRDRRSEGLTEEEISRLESLGYLQP